MAKGGLTSVILRDRLLKAGGKVTEKVIAK